MKGDFSRFTFAEENHYRRVLMQQGRVQIDADGNEQIAIDGYLAATTSTDVIGAAGYPVESLPVTQPAGGFALGLNAAGTDLTLSPGRMYVDGLLAENDTPDATLLNQPDMPGVTLAQLGATQSGIYVVYLDVWERLITALDNPLIKESALGGPDTSVRTKLVWQVKLAYLGATPAAGSAMPTCASAAEPWLPAAATTGTLAASSGAPGTDLPCILPPETGYQYLENQLYRVEIHNPGPDGTATFKWSRENGSVAALISSQPSANGAPPPVTVTGPTFWATSLSSDPTLGVKAQDWVELTDDSSELIAGHGTLYQVAGTPTDGHTVTIQVPAGPSPTVTLLLHPKLRRWDQGSAGGSQGIPVTTAAPIPLEGGVQVQFSAGTYQTGDYWLIPARTATSVQQGYVEWPVDASSNALPQPPVGIRHSYAQLGLIEFTAPGTFGGLGTATAPTDCRLPFLPLTSLMPAQSLSPCTIVAQPGPGWEQPILTYFANAPAPAAGGTPPDAEICFTVGDFPVSSPLVIANAGHVRISGAGWGTRLIAATGASGPESVLQFVNCLSVGVRDLYGETSQVTTSRGSAGRSHINGTLAFSNCGEASIEGVWLRCGSTVFAPGAACISVGTDVTPGNAATGAGSVRIRSCLLHVGEMQVGIQLSHQARAVVEDNEITIDPRVPATTLPIRLADPGYKAVARSYLISQVAPQAAQAQAATTPSAAGTAPAEAGPAATPPAGAAPAGAGAEATSAEAAPAEAAPAEAAGTAPADAEAETTPAEAAPAETAPAEAAGTVPAGAGAETTPAEAAPAEAAPAEATAARATSAETTAARAAPAEAAAGGLGPAEAATAGTAPAEAAGTAPAEAAGTAPAEAAGTAPATAAGTAPATAASSAALASGDIAATSSAALASRILTVNVGSQVLRFAATGDLQSTWQTYLDANAPKTFATQTDAIRYVKAAADTILTSPAARAGLSNFGSILHFLNLHVPLAGRGIVVGGQAIGDLQIVRNAISGVLMGISAGVSHRASTAEQTAKQRVPDHMQTVRIIGNTINCNANDVATKHARFGIFVGTANSLELEDNRVTLSPAGLFATAPPADAIRVVGYLGMKAVIRRNYVTGFAMGIRAVPLTGNGPGTRAAGVAGVAGFMASYTEPTRSGSLWLIADNAIEGANPKIPPIGPFWKTKYTTQNPAQAVSPSAYIDAPACMQVDNVHP